MPTFQTPYDAVLRAARDVAAVDTALDAEMLGSALLGSVYAVADSERAAAVQTFVGGFLAHTSRRRTPAARAIRTVFASLAPEAAGAAKVRPGPDPPPWLAQLGQVRPVGTWAYGDVYGDQISYLAIFSYDDTDLGGSEHAVVALVDHNIGIVKDVFVTRRARRVLDEIREASEADELIWLAEVGPGTLRARVSAYLNVTDGLVTLPGEGSLATDRALVGARLATLPEAAVSDDVVASAHYAHAASSAPADPEPLIPAFLDSPQAAILDRSTAKAEAVVQYVLRLIQDFARDAPDGDPLRWSPAVAGLFLLDWVHRRAVLDDDDMAALPEVLRAWAGWAAARRGLPAAAREATDEAIELLTPEFARLHGTGERRGAAVEAVSRLLADGINPDDPVALNEWMTANLPSGNSDNSRRPD